MSDGDCDDGDDEDDDDDDDDYADDDHHHAVAEADAYTYCGQDAFKDE